jgi:hypothetical protein
MKKMCVEYIASGWSLDVHKLFQRLVEATEELPGYHKYKYAPPGPVFPRVEVTFDAERRELVLRMQTKLGIEYIEQLVEGGDG